MTVPKLPDRFASNVISGPLLGGAHNVKGEVAHAAHTCGSGGSDGYGGDGSGYAAPAFAARTASCEGLTRSFDGGAGGVSNSAAANENAKVREGGFFGC